MNIELGGEEGVKGNVEGCLRLLSDLKTVASFIPDSEGFSVVDKDAFMVRIKVNIGPIKGKFVATCKIREMKANRISYGIEWRGTGSEVNILMEISLEKKDSENVNMRWKAVAELNGLITGIGESRIRSIADKYIETMISSLKQVAVKSYMRGERYAR
jgi:carbon monoxide dehydrogenase subunit G